MAPSDPNQPQPAPEPEHPRNEPQPDGASVPSRRDRAEGRSPGRHRAPSTQEPESDHPWGVSSEAPIDLLPGEPLVRVSHAWAQSAIDPSTGEPEVFTGLTPRVAAMLIVTYTRPGDVVIDTTADLAVEGTAVAGSRHYHRQAVTPDPGSEGGWSPSRASLVILRWPTDPSPETGGDTTRHLPAEADLEPTLTAGRRLAAPDAHLVVVSDPGSGSHRDPSRQLIQAVRVTGGGRLRHVVRVGHGPHDDAADDTPDAPLHVADAQLRLLVFVVTLRPGGRHA